MIPLTALLRSLGALALGILVVLVGVAGVEALGAVLHPFPPGLDPLDLEACRVHVSRFPASVLALVVVLWGAIAGAGSWVATRLGHRRHAAHGIGVGLLSLAAVAFNLSMLPYPGWFWINLLTVPSCALLAARWAGPAPTGS